MNLGSLYARVRRYDLAVEALREALPAPEAFNKVAEASMENGDYDTAARLLEEAIRNDPTDRLVAIRAQHYALADALGLDGAALLDETFEQLEQLVAGVRLVREVSVRVRVRDKGTGLSV